MTTQTEALKMTRQLLWRYRHETPIGNQPHMICHEVDEAFERIDEALAQPEQEPVANVVLRDGLPTLLANNQIKPTDERLYTAPPQRKPLTDEQKVALCKKFPDHLTFNAIKAIEAAHGIKE